MSDSEKPKKPWTKPTIERKPYAEMIEILRVALKQAEQAVTLHPADADAVMLRDALRRQLADLESDHAA